MQHEKCCYCEIKIPPHGHSKAVEHFRPKSIYKNLTNDWGNLLLACAQCNGKKSDKFPLKLTNNEKEAKVIHTKYNSKKKKTRKAILIDPSKEDPEKYLDFVIDQKEKETYGLIIAKDNNRRGKITIEIVGLYDSHYLNNHRDFMRDSLIPTFSMMESAKDHNNYDKFRSLKQQFEIWMDETYKLSALSRAFVRYYELDKDYKIQIPS